MQGNSKDLSLNQILFSFTGRIGRKTFWIIWFSMMVAGLFIAMLISAISFNSDKNVAAAIIIYILYLIPSIWIGLAMQVKRWHDRDKSGWWVLIGLIPLVGLIWTLVELGFLAGTHGPNQYGDDPLPSIESASDQNVS